MDQATFDAAKRNGKKGAVPSKYATALKSAKRGSLSWSDVGPEDLVTALAAVTEDGAALLLSKTSDGGALLIQVLESEQSKPKFYAASMAELNEVLANLAEA
jgi:hypothetical protein